MKYFNKSIVFLVFMLFGYGVDTFAFKYKISNQTGRDIKVQLHYAFGKLNEKAIFIFSRGVNIFVFKGWLSGLCLTKIMVSTRKLGKWGKLKEAQLIDPLEFTADRLYGLIPISTGVCASKRFVLKIDPMFDDLIALMYDY